MLAAPPTPITCIRSWSHSLSHHACLRCLFSFVFANMSSMIWLVHAWLARCSWLIGVCNCTCRTRTRTQGFSNTNKVWFVSLDHRPASQQDASSSGGSWTRFQCVTYIASCIHVLCACFISTVTLLCLCEMYIIIVISLLAATAVVCIRVTASVFRS
jgi:hypothetical protein